jgi:hypothetical protein
METISIGIAFSGQSFYAYYSSSRDKCLGENIISATGFHSYDFIEEESKIDFSIPGKRNATKANLE